MKRVLLLLCSLLFAASVKAEEFCDICNGLSLLNPDGIIRIFGSTPTCGEAQASGYFELVSSDACSIVQAEAKSPCGCIDEDEPGPCDVCGADRGIGSPDGLINLNGDLITCAATQALADSDGITIAKCLLLQESNSACGCVDEDLPDETIVEEPTRIPILRRSNRPTVAPSGRPTVTCFGCGGPPRSGGGSDRPTGKPTGEPTLVPSGKPSSSSAPSYEPSFEPSSGPSSEPSLVPSAVPTPVIGQNIIEATRPTAIPPVVRENPSAASRTSGMVGMLLLSLQTWAILL
jgi:hypothetical protein